MSTVFFTLYILWKSGLFDGANAVHSVMAFPGKVYYLPWTKKYMPLRRLCGIMLLNQPVGPADCLLVLGSRDDRVAVYGAELCRTHSFKQVMISGGAAHQKDLLATRWSESTEAAHFLKAMRASGYNGEVLLEDQATNTGENAVLSYALLKKQGSLPVESLLIVTKPYMERRALATFEAQWPEKATILHVTSPQLILDEYINNEQPFDDVVNIMVGDLQRIIDYPKRGFQSEQHVPSQVLDAADLLKSFGFTMHL